MERTSALTDLARMYGIETGYSDYAGTWRDASPDAVAAVLRALGCDTTGSGADASDHVRERRLEMWSHVVPPVIVSRSPEAPRVDIRLPASVATGRIRFSLRLESGRTRRLESRLENLSLAAARSVEGRAYVSLSLRLPVLPVGTHDLFTLIRGQRYRTRVFVATGSSARQCGIGWGSFAPLYALRSDADWGTGRYADLDRLAAWTVSAGGSSVATLPLLAAFLDEPFDPGPYVPVSRRFLNELFVDLATAPELADSPEARELLASPGVQSMIRELQTGALVDYRRAAALSHRVLAALAATFFERDPSGRPAFLSWLSRHRDAGDYARFRGACRRFGSGWRAWPDGPRAGILAPGDWDTPTARNHLYAQWLATLQLRAARRSMRGRGVGLQLDLPLGTHPDGYDVWRRRDLFANGVSVGAPPDEYFEAGQDWGFPPELPASARTDRYAYWRSCLGFQMRLADVLRVDHIMSLHRTFWVPHGLPAAEGVYVRGFPEERYAILCLEAHGTGCKLVGEDLGTVPEGVRASMDSNDVRRMFVFDISRPTDGTPDLDPVPPGSVACVNTHDMYPFASLWDGGDIADRLALGRLDERRAVGKREERGRSLTRVAGLLRDRGYLAGEATASEVYTAILRYLAESDASHVIVNLEDLWGETHPQNVPGTTDERPNWRRRARVSLEELEGDDGMVARLRGVFGPRRPA